MQEDSEIAVIKGQIKEIFIKIRRDMEAYNRSNNMNKNIYYNKAKDNA